MKTEIINGKKHVLFSTNLKKSDADGIFFPLDSLEHLYCLTMKNLRESSQSNHSSDTVNALNVKRRSLLLQIRRASKTYLNGRLMPLGVTSMHCTKRTGKIGHYTILG